MPSVSFQSSTSLSALIVTKVEKNIRGGGAGSDACQRDFLNNYK